ncbi:MAG: type II toxin-antitoxin system RelE/ParE family toxin [Clostridiales bacterium]|nr:type II toxin-antitoxin system RelE/ParE family toxin [Clostridiales bacterium]
MFYFIYVDKNIILLHGFIKKQRKTPRNEIDTACNYMNDFIKRYSDWLTKSTKNLCYQIITQ